MASFSPLIYLKEGRGGAEVGCLIINAIYG